MAMSATARKRPSRQSDRRESSSSNCHRKQLAPYRKQGPGLSLMTPHNQNEPSGPNANILLVDDQPANLLALEAILGDLGQNLVKARSGKEALGRLLQDDFAVVLLDVQMEGLDGFETAK